MKVKILQVGPLGTNCYLLMEEDEKVLAIIDPGEEAKRIQKLVFETGCKVKYILLTHGHYDHTTAVPALHKAYPDAEIYIHAADANGAGSQLFPLAGQVPDLKHYTEGDQLELGGHIINVIHTPGHSPGSVVLHCEDILFTGDTMFASSCGRTDLPGGNYKQIMLSLKRLGELEGDFHVCPGHDRTSTLEQERQTNFFLAEAMYNH